MLAWFRQGEWHSLAKCPSRPQLKQAMFGPRPFIWATCLQNCPPPPCPCQVGVRVHPRSIGTRTLFIHHGALLQVNELLFRGAGGAFLWNCPVGFRLFCMARFWND